MTKTSVSLAFLLMPLFLLWLQDSRGADDLDSQDETLILDSFELPLRNELLRKGYTPRNAAIAAQHLLDDLVKCWTNEQNTLSHSKPRTIVVQLGGATIVTYESPCLTEFLSNVRSLP